MRKETAASFLKLGAGIVLLIAGFKAVYEDDGLTPFVVAVGIIAAIVINGNRR